MKIHIKREDILALLFLLPYVENNMVAKTLNIVINSKAYIKAVVVLILVVSLVLFLFNVILPKKRIKKRYYGYVMLLFCIYLLFSVFTGKGDKYTSLCTWTWIVIPIFYSIQFVYFCRLNKYDYDRVLVSTIRLFCFFVFVAVLYNIPFRQLFIDPDVRLNPRGGGSVIFGYTIAVMFSLCLYMKSQFSPMEYYLILAIFTIGALATQSRASVWPVVFLWFANYFLRGATKKRIIIYVMLIPVIVVLSTVDYASIFSSTSTKGWARLLNVHSIRRFGTVEVLLEYVKSLDVKNFLFGSGLGNFFPYMHWDLNIKDVEKNLFIFHGASVLVQPHNSFLFFLIESGVIGVGLFISEFVFTIIEFMKSREHNKIFLIIIVGVIILVNNLDSVFYVQPGVAANYWIILFLLIEKHISNTEKNYEGNHAK